jgi:fatty-acyl-CoA synthase
VSHAVEVAGIEQGDSGVDGRVQCREEDIREFCRGHIAHYKVPRYVRFVDGFPLTIIGKVQKFLIREQLRSELRLAEDDHA